MAIQSHGPFEHAPIYDKYKKLLMRALEARKNAHAPYSKFKVGAALLTKKGNVFSGCNVENASYGLTICAERNAIFQAVTSEGSGLKIVVIATVCSPDKKSGVYTSCGSCRQVIQEFSDKNTKIISANTEGKVEIDFLNHLLKKPFKL